jgi:hypothetical protein
MVILVPGLLGLSSLSPASGLLVSVVKPIWKVPEIFCLGFPHCSGPIA